MNDHWKKIIDRSKNNIKNEELLHELEEEEELEI
jgi:hypothetical protein